jgi:Rieske Fe-S protein
MLQNHCVSIALLLIALLCSTTGCGPHRPDPVRIGTVSDFPSGSVTDLKLATSFVDPDPPATVIVDQNGSAVTQPAEAEIDPVPILIVNDPQRGFLAFYAREPHLGCRVEWDPANNVLVSPCYGEQYTLAGECIYGPCERNLDQFGVIITVQDEILIDVQDFRMGKSAGEEDPP